MSERGKIATLPPSGEHSPAEVLALAARKGLSEVMVAGRHPDGSIYVHCSRGMTNAEANWFLDQLKLQTLGAL